MVQKNILLNNDTIVLDENSIVPGSFSIKDDIDTTKISILPLKSLLIVKDTTLFGKSIRISYRTFGFAFYKPYYHKSVDTILKHKYTGNNPFVFRYNVQQADDYFSDASLNKSGNISRGVIDSRNLVYFISIISSFLFLTTQVLNSRKWK